MKKLKQQFEQIPWASFGQQTPISELARSIVPVGNFPAPLPSGGTVYAVGPGQPDFERYMMDIEGTAFQAGRGKLLTCWHVCQALHTKEGCAYLQATSERQGDWLKTYWPIQTQFSFVDPRLEKGNSDVDVGIVICAPSPTDRFPYDVPIVAWGDSTQVGVGERVLIGGFPLGREMFLALATNRGVVQPTFYDGVISAIIPATRNTETRLLQISSIAIGGMSGGVVCDPENGNVLGMVTGGLSQAETGQSYPITYAIPSEVLQPYVEAISFQTEDGQIWR